MNGQERVVLDLTTSDKAGLYGKITDRRKEKGYEIGDWDSLDLGFKLPAGWPADQNCQVTLAQLVVIAVKLDMSIVINSLNVLPTVHEFKEGSKDNV